MVHSSTIFTSDSLAREEDGNLDDTASDTAGEGGSSSVNAEGAASDGDSAGEGGASSVSPEGGAGENGACSGSIDSVGGGGAASSRYESVQYPAKTVLLLGAGTQYARPTPHLRVETQQLRTVLLHVPTRKVRTLLQLLAATWQVSMVLLPAPRTMLLPAVSIILH